MENAGILVLSDAQNQIFRAMERKGRQIVDPKLEEKCSGKVAVVDVTTRPNRVSRCSSVVPSAMVRAQSTYLFTPLAAADRSPTVLRLQGSLSVGGVVCQLLAGAVVVFSSSTTSHIDSHTPTQDRQNAVQAK